MNYAGVFRRAIALVLDYIFLSLFFFPIAYLVKGTWLMMPEDHVWGGIFDPLCAVYLIVIFLYFIFTEWLWGQTLGKLIMSIKVVAANNSKISFKQSLIRNIGRMIDGIFCYAVGLIAIVKSSHNQRIADKWAGTYVAKV